MYTRYTVQIFEVSCVCARACVYIWMRSCARLRSFQTI